MKKELVNVVFDRRKLYAKRGMAYLEVMVYLGRKGRRYLTVCTSTPEKLLLLPSAEELPSEETVQLSLLPISPQFRKSIFPCSSPLDSIQAGTTFSSRSFASSSENTPPKALIGSKRL